MLLGLLVLVPATVLAAAKAKPGKDPFLAAYEAANALYDGGEYVKALEAYRKALAIRAAPEVVYGMARAHDRLGRSDEAALAYQRFLEDAPAHPAAAKARGYLFVTLLTLGERAAAERRWEAARDALVRAEALEVSADVRSAGDAGARVLARLGDALAGLGDRAGAVASLERARDAATGPELRAEIEVRLGALRATAPDGPGVSPPAEPESPRRGPPWLWLGVGGGAALVAGGVLAIVLVLVLPARPGQPLGWWRVEL